jgi:nucleoside-diphosphate-sugar epimerase
MADTVLVTGACGFIAPYIVEELLRKGYSVRATDLPDADFAGVEGLDCEIVKADLLKKDQASLVMQGVDSVVHTAARMNYFMDRTSFELANYQVTVNTCEAAANAGIKRFVHFSTCDTYGPPEYSPVDEAHPQHPLNLYAVTKLYGEKAAFRCARDTGLPVSVIRPTAVYGPKCVYVMGLFLAVPIMVRELGIKMLPLPKQGFLGNLVHVEDIAGATVFVMEQEGAVGEAYNVSDDSSMPAGQLIETILDSIGVRSKRILPFPTLLVSTLSRVGSHLPRFFFERLTDYLQGSWDKVVIDHGLVPMLKPRFDPGFTAFGRGNYDFNNAKLKALGYELKHPDFKTGWNDTVRWFEDNEWIPRLKQA